MASLLDHLLRDIPRDAPVLIAGPTASGKSALALAVAEAQGGVIVNADASQVYDCWRIVTARPSPEEEAGAPHMLYGHVAFDADYSAGHWLREVADILSRGLRPIIVGGTGLYFAALTEGLSDIPPVPRSVRETADTLSLADLLQALDPETRTRIDTQNRARVQRAWEVLQATGQCLAHWQDRTAPPLLPLDATAAFVFDAPKDWLNPRIERRFDRMIEDGALQEVARMAPHYDPSLPAFRAIGVPELHAHLIGTITLEEARDQAIIATRQYAKRQRTWFRKRCRDWQWISAETLTAQ
jgi:tRNA dimethylallyltransferase